MNINKSSHPLFTSFWLILWISICVSFAIFLPGFSEFDTSKYLSISQEMMKNHHYLLAYWQGHPYSDKPPLLFWLFIAGWHVFGFSTWWPQLVVLCIALFSILITQRLSLALWPNKIEISRLVPFILIGCFYWVWFAKQIRVDSILVLATLLCFLCIIRTIQGHAWYWLGYTLAIGLGGFAKGPVILAFVLLPAIFMPTMMTSRQKLSLKWFGLLGLTTVIGLSIPLLWAIPAAIQGGKLFTQEIFYRQITHRQSMSQSSFFFYFKRLPLWLLPWSIYPPLYKNLLIKTQSLVRGSYLRADTACIIIVICGLIAFSVFGQKLPHYIYPLFPFFALLIARLCSNHTSYHKTDQWPMATLVLFLSLFCLLFPYLSTKLPNETYIRGYFLQEINLTPWGGLFLFFAIALFIINVKTVWRQIIFIALVNFSIILFVNNIILYQYQHHLNSAKIISSLEKMTLAIVAQGKFSDPQINAYIKKNNIKQISEKELKQWHLQSNRKILITSDKEILHQKQKQKQKPLAWTYQTRFSVVSVWR